MMSLHDALAGVDALGFDTAPFIYFVERHPAYVDLVREVIRRVDAGAIEGYSSVVTITEVLTQPLCHGNAALEREYRDFFLRGRNLTLVPIDLSVAERAADLRARYRLRTPDALQIAAALEAGCQAFLTNDGSLQRVADLRILVLDSLTL